jgi:hypothetical protein
LNNEWPSVARCKPGQISTDFEACDHNNKGEFQHDKIPPSQFEQVQLNNEWPSVARCKPGQISTDFEACDHNNKGEFQHDKIPPSQFEQVQLSAEFRPAIKCEDPVTGNPISCHDGDINSSNMGLLNADANKNAKLETEVRVIPAGANADSDAKGAWIEKK